MSLRALPWAVFVIFIAGCRSGDLSSKASQESAKPEPKLKALLASTDRVLNKDFYEAQAFSPAVRPPKVESYGIKTTWIPGFISFEPVTVSEPPKEQGNEAKKVKGLRVQVRAMNFMVSTTKGETHEQMSFLDDDEGRDFDNALTYLATVESQWAKQKPDHEREITFKSKDDFEATLAIVQNAPALLVESGRINNAMLEIPGDQIGEVQSKLRAALKTLDAH